jgi:hypothetical protein
MTARTEGILGIDELDVDVVQAQRHRKRPTFCLDTGFVLWACRSRFVC